MNIGTNHMITFQKMVTSHIYLILKKIRIMLVQSQWRVLLLNQMKLEAGEKFLNVVCEKFKKTPIMKKNSVIWM